METKETQLQQMLTQLRTKLLMMGAAVGIALDEAGAALMEGNAGRAAAVVDGDAAINAMENEIDELALSVLVRNQPVAHDLRFVVGALRMVIDLERIGDLAENIVEYGESIEDKGTKFSQEAYEEMRIMGDKTLETLATGLDVFAKRDRSRVPQVAALEQEIDDLKRDYIQNHIDRLSVKACDPQAGVVFTNLITTLERITDHTNNIAQTLLEEQR